MHPHSLTGAGEGSLLRRGLKDKTASLKEKTLLTLFVCLFVVFLFYLQTPNTSTNPLTKKRYSQQIVWDLNCFTDTELSGIRATCCSMIGEPI
jgi:hypothetical protein